MGVNSLCSKIVDERLEAPKIKITSFKMNSNSTGQPFHIFRMPHLKNQGQNLLKTDKNTKTPGIVYRTNKKA